ncbi:type II secretion system F family protein [Anaeromicrobium sediminis]|uniref:Type II secretion system protein F n=1 Tax=Anaeromicrobium sediminis TaxID=1478221 RepID=A0A267MGI3_9FIRM|nr:type II secretion system F family protein [Anaeromicrobium sediminis]PAB58512.1 type II secretion system protein F [Anaeromicrobium sediminis]
MPTYKYKGISKTGEKIEGTYTARDKQAVIRMIRENQNIPIKVEEVIEGSKKISLGLFGKVKIKDIAIFCRQFYTMLNAGVTIINCLDILRLQTENKRLRKVIGEVHEEVQKGFSFSESLRKHREVFPDLLINMAQTGEVSGTLDVIMGRMAIHYEKENNIRNKVQGAMMYPIILSVISIIIVIFLLTVVMPIFLNMFIRNGAQLPLPTRILLFISNIMTTYWYIFVTFVILSLYGIQKIVKTDKVKFLIDHIKFRIPVVKGTAQKVITSRFTRTLSTLLSSGIPLMEALDIVSRVVDNVIVEKGILRAKEEVRKGADLATPIKEIGVFPPMLDSMIRIGEESGTLDDILDKTANFYDEEVEASIGKMTKLMEPLMIVVMSFIVGAIVTAMLMPMLDMMSTMP